MENLFKLICLVVCFMEVGNTFAKAQTSNDVELKMEYRAENCYLSDPQYIVDLYVRNNSSTPKYLGNSSIYFTYDPGVLAFNKYESINFNENNHCLLQSIGEFESENTLLPVGEETPTTDTDDVRPPKGEANINPITESPFWEINTATEQVKPSSLLNPVNPYAAQQADGETPGHFLVTIYLVQPSIQVGSEMKVFSCTEINDWTLVGSVYFDVKSIGAVPNFEFVGTPQGMPTDTKGCNFSTDINKLKYPQDLIVPEIDFSYFMAVCVGANKTGGEMIENETVKLYPNPFNATLNFSYTASEKGDINIALYNKIGQKIKNLTMGQSLDIGNQTWQFDLDELPNGMYYIQTEMNGVVEMNKVVKVN